MPFAGNLDTSLAFSVVVWDINTVLPFFDGSEKCTVCHPSRIELILCTSPFCTFRCACLATSNELINKGGFTQG